MSKKLLRELRDGIQSGQLTQAQRCKMDLILGAIMGGHDVRKWYGIKPKKGRPPATSPMAEWAIIYFKRLRLENPNAPVKVHVGLAAKESGLSDKRIRDLARKYRTTFPAPAPLTSLDIAEILRLIKRAETVR
jgi:hypothetical protein